MQWRIHSNYRFLKILNEARNTRLINIYLYRTTCQNKILLLTYLYIGQHIL
jgi:hypothetical protein